MPFPQMQYLFFYNIPIVLFIAVFVQLKITRCHLFCSLKRKVSISRNIIPFAEMNLKFENAKCLYEFMILFDIACAFNFHYFHKTMNFFFVFLCAHISAISSCVVQ